MSSKPKVFIDGFNLALEKGTGVSTYARNLSYELKDSGHEVGVLYGGRAYSGKNSILKEIDFFDSMPIRGFFQRYTEALSDFFFFAAPTHPKQVPVTDRVIKTTFKSRMPLADELWNSHALFERADIWFELFGMLKSVCLPSDVDLMHWTYPLPIRAKGVPNVYTLHDLVPLRLPYTTLDAKKSYLKLMKRIAASADAILTVSENSRNDIIDLIGCPETKVFNTYQSVNVPQKLRDTPDEAVKREVEGVFDLPYKEYFLFFGSIEPKKNIGRLIEGYLASKVQGPLVIVGARAWKSEQELRLINPGSNNYLEQIENITRSRERIRRFDYASFPLLVSLIRGARAVVFPSLYEGFGLPVLESMQLGTPVISSKEGSVPEVAGEAAILVDPHDPRALAEAIIEVDQSAELRDELSAKGRVQAEKFSSAAHQARLQSIYDKVLTRRYAW